MLKKSHYIALGLMALLAVVFLNLPSRASTRLKLAIGGLFLPLFGLASGAQQAAGSAGDAMLPRGTLISQNETLRRENQQLRVLALQNQALTNEVNQLRKQIGWQLGWQAQTGWKLKLANVVLREPANWWRTVQIDLGSRDGIVENLTVLTPEGLVGRIASVNYTSSKVVLVGDPNCRVSATVVEAKEMGIIGPSGPLDRTMVEMNYLSRSATLKPGQHVVTSDLGKLFRKGIPIGQVADSSAVEFGLYTQAHIKLAVNLNALEEVWVLMP